MSSRNGVAAVALVLLGALAAGCATNPVTGRREFSLVTPEQELAIGQEGYPATVAEYGQYEDRAVDVYVDSVGQRVARASDLPNLKWTFTVLDDPVVNAFAMPGGYIYVTRGILAHLESEAQLAGVLGHEIGHVCARHSAKQLTQQQLAGLGLGLASAFSETFRRYGGAAQQALGLLMLKYSRDDETQADQLGVRYATAAGYDPREIPATYATLKRISDRAGDRLPAFLSTHPDPGDREQRTTALAATAAAGRSGLIVRGPDYIEHLRGLVYGDDPRQGYVEGGRYIHPSLGIEIAFPAGWTLQNGRTAVAAAAPSQKALMQMSLAANAGTLPPGDFVAALTRDGRIAGARGGSETIGGWPAWAGHVDVPQTGGASVTLLAAFVRTNATTMLEFLGQSALPDDADDRAAFAAVRSLRPLSDPALAHPTPARLRLARATLSGAFADAIAKLSPGATSVDELAILNGTERDAPVNAGETLKLVDPARRR